MKKIYLVRHGESEWNVLKKIQGQQNIALTQKGIEQAHLIGERLINENIEKIYSSDLNRAYITAKIIGNKLNLAITPMKEFREINFGVWEGISNDKMIEEHQDDLALWRNEPEKLQIEGAETLKELQIRAMNGLNKIIHNDRIDNVLIVSHSATLKTIILGLLNMNLANFKNLTINNVSLSIVEIREHNKVLKLFNDICHIKES
ncbi:Phosphoglycerate mutase/fructose-2,6-bisphosphatase [[Clostridium] ultunense Esp]|uniref:Phosphoglycerate mutase/fructose-2,6-bisphosphatase n=1 Tax=[Clostridium] ultunense Esp TaxID=1288971 RepID=M1ZG28_9FIRM|nr:histidine phosphatase family protein [Schnuerera ultunensis]CCQ92672.1 Phosphoglycerate mutase/fructose-2,6-bisphosphatase [[Clostridium] ultunense Esp]SHD77117.1 Phosphoglycerate mutase/fructose-2,6-bisphosphatase [[Clostridium] ultunense Esp]